MVLGEMAYVSLVCTSHEHRLLEDIQDLWLAQEMCDVLLSCEDGNVWAHAPILAAFSAYFKVGFTSAYLVNLLLLLLLPETINNDMADPITSSQICKLSLFQHQNQLPTDNYFSTSAFNINK